MYSIFSKLLITLSLLAGVPNTAAVVNAPSVSSHTVPVYGHIYGIPDYSSSQDVTEVQSEIEQATSSAPLPVLIEFYATPGNYEASLIKSFGGTVTRSYHIIPAVAALVPKENILTLFNQPEIKTVEMDHHGTRKSILNNPEDYSDIKHLEPLATTTILSSDVSVAFVDTGIDYYHPDIAPAYAGGYNFITNTKDSMDDNDHGTRVAGVMMNVIKNLISSTTPPSHLKLYSLKVLDQNGVGSFSNIIAALEWSLDHKIDIVNNSYSSEQDPGNIVRDAYDAAENNGVLLIASAGNSGVCGSTEDTVSFPARFRGVLAVGAVKKDNTRPCFSSTGPEIGLVAPGVRVIGARRGGGHIVSTGTSMATPYVSGVAAILMMTGVEDHNHNNKINDDVISVLEKSAVDIGAPGKDLEFGYGLVDIKNALSQK